MNKLSLLIFSLVGSMANASGTLTLKKPVFGQNKRSEVGLYIQEPISNKLEYQSWSGTGIDQWVNTQHHVMYKLNKKLYLGTGPSYQYTDEYKHDVRLEAVLQWKLWN
jgi:hypothetical protein